jgi:hypothetical protein
LKTKEYPVNFPRPEGAISIGPCSQYTDLSLENFILDSYANDMC